MFDPIHYRPFRDDKLPTLLAEKLKYRIKEEFDVEVIPEIHRTRAGYWQKATGAFSWFMLTYTNQYIGSQFKAKDVLKAKRLSNTWTDNTQMAIDIEEYGTK